jgi:hypothetical protein
VAAPLLDRWNRFWFAPAPATALGVCRLAFFVGLLLHQWPFVLHRWVGIPAIYRRPMWTFRILHLPFLSENAVIALQVAWAIAMALAAIGLFTRVATCVAFLLGFYLLSLANNFGKIGHGDQALVLTMLILALARCGDAVSIDALLSRRRGRAAPGDSGEYRWPIRMVWLLMALVFCAAGASKLVRNGLAWITTDHLALTLIQAHYHGVRPTVKLGLYLAQFALLCKLMAAGVVAMELAFPLALLSRRLRVPIVVATLLMQIGIGLLMGVWFRQFLLLYLFWVPWERVVGALARSTPAREPGPAVAVE